MKVKAYWKSKNPFLPDVEDLSYSKTVEVPDNTSLEDLKKFAIKDSREGYSFDKLEKLEQVKK